MPDPQGVTIDPNELAAVKIAVGDVVKTFTYAGLNVGDYVTDDELNQVATAALAASINFRSNPAI